jgi:uncharacterized membrane protein
MSRDNVTPFRRPPKRTVAPQQRGGMGMRTHRGKAVLVHVLTLLTLAIPWTLGGVVPFVDILALGVGVAAGLIAISSRTDAMPWAATHHEQALRTLIIFFVVKTLLQLPYFILPPGTAMQIAGALSGLVFWGGLVVTLWAGLRALAGVVLALMRRAVPNPRGWLI